MKRKILKFTTWSLGVLLILFIALGIHLYFVTGHFYQAKGPQLQMSRIDFNQPVDSVEGAKIQSFVNHIDGVQKSYFNLEDDILVYAFYNDRQTSQNVFNELMASGDYNAEKYVVSEDDKKTGCPAMSGGSVTGLLLVYKNLFSLFNL